MTLVDFLRWYAPVLFTAAVFDLICWTAVGAIWYGKRRRARILKERFAVEIRQHNVPLLVIPEQEKAEKVRVHGWPYQPDQPQRPG